MAIGRFTAIEIVLNLFLRQHLRHHSWHFSVVVTVKVMAPQTGFPALIVDQRGMWDVDRIVVQRRVFVTMLTDTRRDTHPYAQVLLMAAHAELHAHCLSGVGEFGFQKIVHRMSIVRIFVACPTLFVARWRVNEIARGICKSNRIRQVTEGLADNVTRTWGVTIVACDFGVPDVVGPSGVPGFTPGHQK